VQHVEGAGGLNGTVFAQRQPADGFTFVAGTQSTLSLDIRDMLGFDFREEFVPVAKMVHATKGLVASRIATQNLFSDFAGFVNYMRANPGTLTVGLRSPGGADEVSLVETVALALNIPVAEAREMVRIVPFSSGSEQDAAVAGGHIHLTLQGFNESPGLIAAGEAIPLVVLSEARIGPFPNVPSTGELGIPSYIGTWRGIFARRGTPQASIDAMEKAIEHAWHTEGFQTFAAAGGYLDRGEGFIGQAGLRQLVDDEYIAFTDFLVAAGLIPAR
jgi:tripartite-type tricarboxylate transporter receptor subunit TctC